MFETNTTNVFEMFSVKYDTSQTTMTTFIVSISQLRSNVTIWKSTKNIRFTRDVLFEVIEQTSLPDGTLLIQSSLLEKNNTGRLHDESQIHPTNFIRENILLHIKQTKWSINKCATIHKNIISWGLVSNFIALFALTMDRIALLYGSLLLF